MFRGDEIHKIGPKKYRIVGGNFTTCVQPTPRWEMQSRSITLTLDDYALLKNALLRVKHVPLMYLPIFYFPIQEDNRATGFVMPIYGSTTARGQSLSNAFFWAISRSQDATFMHDWFSKAGQQMGGEYRYILAPGSEGNSTVSLLNEQIEQPDGTTGPDDPKLHGKRRHRAAAAAESSLPCQRPLLLQPRDAAALSAGHLSGNQLEPHREHERQWKLERVLVERDGRSQRLFR